MSKRSTFTAASVRLFSCLLLCLLVAFIGGWFTEEGLKTWNLDVKKPAWTPPGWVFPLVWTPLYILMGLSLWLVTLRRKLPKPSFWVYFWFMLQLILNLAWSPAIFFYECSLCATQIIGALLVAILMTMIMFHRYVPVAAYLLIPYFIWVVFVGVLNMTIFRINS